MKIWTQTNADALYIEPLQSLALDRDGILTLQYALKRAIERLYQIEPSELGAYPMGKPEIPNIFIYEAAEGSLGVLSQLVDDPSKFREVIEEAKNLLRYDDPKYLAPASYDDLLSYYNQPHHLILDRHLIEDALDTMLVCSLETRTSDVDASYEDQYERLLRELDPTSSTEKKIHRIFARKWHKTPRRRTKRRPRNLCQTRFLLRT